jgi:Ribonuclease G/E
LIILILSVLFGKGIKLIVDGAILRVANIYRAQTRKIKRVAEKKFWDYQMIVCDRNGIVYDMLVHPVSFHEVRSVRIGYRKGYAVGYSFFRKSQIWI